MASFLFRVEASVGIGTGHLARCATLAEACASAGHAVIFLVGADEALVQRWVGGRGWEIVVRDGQPNGPLDLAQTIALASASSSIVVVDGYDFYGPFVDGLIAAGLRVCVVDDLYQTTTPPFAVLNHNVYGDTARYDALAAASTRVLAGPSFALVRDEFVRAREARVCSSRGRRRVLVTLGGSDPVGATPLVMAGLERVDHPGGLDVDVIVGPANPQLDRIREAARASRHRLVVLSGTDRMGELLGAADLVITAGGTTCMEIACVGVPAIVLVIADNQQRVHDAMVATGLALGLGWHADLAAEDVARAASRLLADEPLREAMAISQRRLVDGQGKHRVVAALVDPV